jgi:hypothetical protein
MRAYRETFRKHRILYLLPPLLGAIALGALAFKAPAKYQSTASLWIDNGPLAGSSLNSSTGGQPSASEQTLLTELLATKNFDLDVANGSGLKAYVKSQGGAAQQVSTNLESAVAAGVGSSTPGPQILELTFTGPTPAIAQSALQSLITHLQNAMAYYGQTFGQSAQAYYSSQVKTATAALTKATGEAATYLRAHPGATSQTDQQYAALLAEEQSANGQLANATSQLNQAQSQAAGDGGASTLVRVVDAPSVPTSPTAGKKKAAMTLVGGLFGGLLISLFIIVAKTPSREDRWDVEISGGDPYAGVTPAMPRTPYAMASPGPAAPIENGNGHANGNGNVPAPTGDALQSQPSFVSAVARPERRIVMPDMPAHGPTGATGQSHNLISRLQTTTPGVDGKAGRLTRAAFRRGDAS